MQYDKSFKEEAVRLSDEIGVKKAAEQLGFTAKGVKGDQEAFFSEFPLPAIAHVVLEVLCHLTPYSFIFWIRLRTSSICNQHYKRQS